MLPLNSMLCPGRPPNTTIVVLWRSIMSVLNKAHVDPQFPFVTVASSQRSVRTQPHQVSTNSDHSRIERRRAWDWNRERADILSQDKPIKTIHGDSELIAHMEAPGHGILVAIDSD
jgi:hypothetical protein